MDNNYCHCCNRNTFDYTMLMASISKMKTPDEKRQDDEEQLRYLRNLYTKKDTKRAW